MERDGAPMCSWVGWVPCGETVPLHWFLLQLWTQQLGASASWGDPLGRK